MPEFTGEQMKIKGNKLMENVTIRDADIKDAERILEIYAYYIKNTAITFEYEVPTLDEFR